MKHIMKAQLYQLKRTRLFWMMFLLVVTLQAMSILGYILNSTIDNAELAGSSYTASSGSSIYYYPILFIGVVVGLFCGQDFSDKTTNYELMGGHSRKEVYFGHCLPALVIGAVTSVLLTLIPIAIFTAVYGWGERMSFSGVLVRQLLTCFPYFRIGCVLTCLTFIIRNGYATMVVSFLFSIFGGILSEIAAAPASLLLGVTNLQFLGSYKGWSTYDMLNLGNTIYAYSSAVDAGMVLKTIFSSLTLGGLFLTLGYVFFKQDDLG